MEREKVKSSVYFKWAIIIGVPMGIVSFVVLFPVFLLYGNSSIQMRIVSIILSIGYFIVLRISLKKFKVRYPSAFFLWFSMRIFAITSLGIFLSIFITRLIISFEFVIFIGVLTIVASIPYSEKNPLAGIMYSLGLSDE